MIARGTHGRKSGPVTGLVREAHPGGSCVCGITETKDNHRSLENRERIKIMVACNKLNWYAAYTRVNQELVIKKKARRTRDREFPAPGRAEYVRLHVGRKEDPGTSNSWVNLYPDG